MPHAIVLSLNIPRAAHAPLYVGRYAHGWLFGLLRRIDPQMAEQIHAAPRKPFAIAELMPPQSDQSDQSVQSKLLLRVSLLDDQLVLPLLDCIAADANVQLGDQKLSLDAILTTKTAHPWAGQCSWQELATQAPQRRVWFETSSPTLFFISKAEDRSRRQPLPDALLIGKSLLANWQYHSPLRFDEKTEAALRNTFELDLELVQFESLKFVRNQAGKQTMGGFIGKFCLFLHNDSLMARQYWASLCAYSFYCGLGAKTTYGLGLTHPKFE
jgi:CRISPR-associated endoribonuclease Cas6